MSQTLKTVSCAGSGKEHVEEGLGGAGSFFRVKQGQVDGSSTAAGAEHHHGAEADPEPCRIGAGGVCEVGRLGGMFHCWESWLFQWVLGVPGALLHSTAPQTTQLRPASASHLDSYIPVTSSTRRCSWSAKFR